MKKLLHLILFSIAAASAAYAQDGPPSAPNVWERYAISDQQLSFLFPKLPVVIDDASSCSEIEKHSYYAYADGVVYELTTVSKKKRKIPNDCRSVPRFTAGLFTNRLNNARFSDSTESLPTVTEIDGRKVYKYDKPSGGLMLYDDLANDRWLELVIHKRTGEKIDERFFDSIIFAATQGKDVVKGASSTLGDASDVKQPISTQTTGSLPQVTAPFAVLAKQRAAYTDESRRHNTQGSVMLKVTFLSNGSVGPITPDTTLEYGLTEQAIAAAKKIVFLPKRVNGVPISVTMRVQYNFHIY
jgi:TonB family protein